MKIRTTQDLDDALEADLAWRLKELISLDYDISRGVNVHTGKCRALICLTYAHWEGFLGGSSEKMLRLITSRRHLESELNACVRSILWRGKFKGLAHEKSFTSFGELFSECERSRSVQAVFGKGSRIPTESNLNFRVLEGYISAFNIPKAYYIGQHIQIDRLLGERNRIAHGERFVVDAKNVQIYLQCTIDTMRQWSSDLVDSAFNKSYLV